MSVSLSKGQSVRLEKNGSSLNNILMGLGWDVKKTKGFWGFGGQEQSIDLDASAILFDANGNQLDQVWFRQLKNSNGSVIHTGDNRTGDGAGDDEQIIVQLDKLPSNVKTIVFVVNSFTGQNFSQIDNAFCRLVDRNTNQEIARFNLSAQGSHTAQIMTRVYRQDGGWQFAAIGQNSSGKTFEALLPSIRPHI